MNSKQENFSRLELVPGEQMLVRKRFHYLKMEANVFQQATNLQPPLDPPQPPVDPAQPPAEPEIPQIGFHSAGIVMRRRILDISPRTGYNAQKYSEPAKLLS